MTVIDTFIKDLKIIELNFFKDERGWFSETFNKKTFKVSDARKLFDFLRMFMVKNEEWMIDSVSHRELLFEMYKDEQLFKPGDLVEHDITGLTGKVHRCGANHVICLTEEGVCFKSFVHQLSYLNT